jgi:iron complex outermembrane receptor protein
MTHRLHFRRTWSLLAVCFGCCAAIAADEVAHIGIMKQMSLSELMDIEVTSVSKTPESPHNVAAALAVVTDEHIRRSGATTVPEALRGVPGLYVGRQNSNSWAISSRGFNSINSEKLLVLSDTRSIYTPLFSGVSWDVQDYIMADIERIEVIRGPGAALWGSNAVNGVINITTKNAADTHGTLVETIAGTEERSFATRYGDETKGGVHYRVFGQYSDRDETISLSESTDDWQLAHMGFRADGSPSPQNQWTVQGDIYQGFIGQLAPAVTIIGRPGPTGNLETEVAGGNILGRWRHELSADSDIQLRAYYDRTHFDDPSFTDDLHTVDFDLQHRFKPAARHEILWGLNHRSTWNRNEGGGIFAVRPESSYDQIFSAFVQDKIVLRDGVHVTVGTKAEHNDFSGFELQPSIRAAWDITPTHTVWAAVSRASRVPNRLERDIFIDVTDSAADPVARLLGSDDFDSEELIAYELGYRWRASEVLHIDVALFENRYEGLASLEFGTPFVDPADGRTIIPITNQNLTDGRTRGVETLVTYTPFERWRLSASYSYLEISLDPRGQDINRGEFYEGASPRHQFGLGSYLTLPRGFEFDAHFRYISAIERLPEIPTGEGIPGYSELNLRLAWRATDHVTVALVGQNLLHDDHLEFGTPEARGAIRRSVYLKVTGSF